MVNQRFASISVLLVTGCTLHSLYVEDVTSLHLIEKLAKHNYAIDAGTTAAQFDRAAYCLADGILKRHDAGTANDPDIVCRKPSE